LAVDTRNLTGSTTATLTHKALEGCREPDGTLRDARAKFSAQHGQSDAPSGGQVDGLNRCPSRRPELGVNHAGFGSARVVKQKLSDCFSFVQMPVGVAQSVLSGSPRVGGGVSATLENWSVATLEK
jgi:hypothetical protein